MIGLDEAEAKEEARRNIQSGGQGYTNADVVVKLSGWDSDYSKAVAQGALSALKQLILSDKKLPGVYLMRIFNYIHQKLDFLTRTNGIFR